VVTDKKELSDDAENNIAIVPRAVAAKTRSLQLVNGLKAI